MHTVWLLSSWNATKDLEITKLTDDADRLSKQVEELRNENVQEKLRCGDVSNVLATTKNLAAEYERKAREFEKVVKERDIRINDMQTSLNYKEDILNSLKGETKQVEQHRNKLGDFRHTIKHLRSQILHMTQHINRKHNDQQNEIQSQKQLLNQVWPFLARVPAHPRTMI
jgi:chromosome segregation ATPase